MLIEFSTKECLKEIIKACSSHQKDLDVMALQSPFLWFRAATAKKEKFKIPDNVSLMAKNADMEVNEDTLFDKLALCKTVSDQIQLLYDHTTLNDLGVRLRYMVAYQVRIYVMEKLY